MRFALVLAVLLAPGPAWAFAAAPPGAAAAQWSGVICPQGAASIAYTELAPVTCAEVAYHPKGSNANVVLFQESRWTANSDQNVLGKTTVTFDAASGEI